MSSDRHLLETIGQLEALPLLARHWGQDPKMTDLQDLTPEQLKAAKALTRAIKGVRKAADAYFDIVGGLEIPEALFTVRLEGEVTHFLAYTPEYEGDLDEHFNRACAQDMLCGEEYPWGENPGDTWYENPEVNLNGVCPVDAKAGFCPECLKAALERYPDLEIRIPLREYLKQHSCE